MHGLIIPPEAEIQSNCENNSGIHYLATTYVTDFNLKNPTIWEMHNLFLAHISFRFILSEIITERPNMLIG